MESYQLDISGTRSYLSRLYSADRPLPKHVEGGTKLRVNTIIYHKGCVDGFAALWLVWRALGRPPIAKDRLRVIPKGPKNSLPKGELSGRYVLMLDVILDGSTMRDLRNQCASLLVIDHHPYDRKTLDWLEPDYLIFHDPLREMRNDIPAKWCCSRMLWETMKPTTSAPSSIKYINNVDCKITDPTHRSNYFVTSLRQEMDPKDMRTIHGIDYSDAEFMNRVDVEHSELLSKWDMTIRDETRAPMLVENGRCISMYKMALTFHEGRLAYFATFRPKANVSHRVLVINYSGILRSDICNHLARMFSSRVDFAMSWAYIYEASPHLRYNVTLRSSSNNGQQCFRVDRVAAIFSKMNSSVAQRAQEEAGGGHHCASSFVCKDLHRLLSDIEPLRPEHMEVSPTSKVVTDKHLLKYAEPRCAVEYRQSIVNKNSNYGIVLQYDDLNILCANSTGSLQRHITQTMWRRNSKRVDAVLTWSYRHPKIYKIYIVCAKETKIDSTLQRLFSSINIKEHTQDNTTTYDLRTTRFKPTLE